MSEQRLRRIYRLRGLDRVLYAGEPEWPDGTFQQTLADEGRLVLHKDAIGSLDQLIRAIKESDQIAEQFRLAIEMKTGCPLQMMLEKSEEPDFSPSGVAQVSSEARFADYCECTVHPVEPPADMPQVPEAAKRWILTLVETRSFSRYPDEVIKRLYLLIEELLEEFFVSIDDKQQNDAHKVKFVRNFVSHAKCKDKALCAFIAAELPSAVVSLEPLVVAFDRTQVEHQNFVGRYETVAREIAYPLLLAAIERLRAD